MDHSASVARTDFIDDCARIHRDWHEHAKARDTEALLALYAPEATLESPLVAILLGQETGIVKGTEALRRFLSAGARSRPVDLVRWHRPNGFLTDGKRLLVWEYPRETPDGDQVEIVEVMEIADGLIQRHRIYWGWFGTKLLMRSGSSAL